MKQFVLEFKNLAGQQRGAASISTASEFHTTLHVLGTVVKIVAFFQHDLHMKKGFLCFEETSMLA